MKISVIVSAYKNVRELDFTLHAYGLQSMPVHELIVAQDGDFSAISDVVRRHQAAYQGIKHIWHEDIGFRKCLILNKALVQATGDFIVFTDADCVPRRDVVERFAALAKPRRFVSGGSHINLPASFHADHLTPALIQTQSIFDPSWLAARGVAVPKLRMLPAKHAGWASMLDTLSPRNAFVGNLSGAWKDDLLRVAGFDESFGYGGEDRNLGFRLNNAGIQGLRARHQLVCLHLDHQRPWRNDEQMQANQKLNQHVKRSKVILPRQSILLSSSL